MRRAIARVFLGIALFLGCCGVFLPSVSRVREAAARTQCSNNLKQIGIGLHSYFENQNVFPTGTIANDDLPVDRRLSWFVTLLPYVEQKSLFDKVDTSAAWDAPANLAVVNQFLKTYHCPASLHRSGTSHEFRTIYVGISGIKPDAASLPLKDKRTGFFGYDRAVRPEDVTDGMSQTMIVTETLSSNGPWAQGGFATVRGLDTSNQPYVGEGCQFAAEHRTGESSWCPMALNVLMGDASVRLYDPSLSAATFEAMATIAGKEELGSDF